jgi:Tfp pilus assembly protein FimV
VYVRVLASPSGRNFYSTPRKRTRRPRAPITPVLKETLTKQRESRREQYASALKDARGLVQVHATQLCETFGGHSVDYYTQEIL